MERKPYREAIGRVQDFLPCANHSANPFRLTGVPRPREIRFPKSATNSPPRRRRLPSRRMHFPGFPSVFAEVPFRTFPIFFTSFPSFFCLHFSPKSFAAVFCSRLPFPGSFLSRPKSNGEIIDVCIYLFSGAPFHRKFTPGINVVPFSDTVNSRRACEVALWPSRPPFHLPRAGIFCTIWSGSVTWIILHFPNCTRTLLRTQVKTAPWRIIDWT